MLWVYYLAAGLVAWGIAIVVGHYLLDASWSEAPGKALPAMGAFVGTAMGDAIRRRRLLRKQQDTRESSS
ncbi:hypothetical protein [Kineococcus glutinatus]|uniref:hypothetical protein n=1 Tax=Kineococcus glutinatus TaxID=1070872 RepID=UPI0031E755B7